jgi:D-alanyl-D-alanine dipeptidase
MYNILIQFHLLLSGLPVFCNSSFGQATKNTTITIMQDVKKLREVVSTDPNQRMVDLTNYIPNLVFDLKYSKKDNFTHQVLYPAKIYYSFLRLPAASALREIC